MKKLPNFDDLSISKIYELSDDEDDLMMMLVTVKFWFRRRKIR